jgi:hypothetical protein
MKLNLLHLLDSPCDLHIKAIGPLRLCVPETLPMKTNLSSSAWVPFEAMKMENGQNGTHPKMSPTEPKLPLPVVSDLDLRNYKSQEALIEDAIKSLKISGGCVIRNLLAKEQLDEIEKDVRPHLDAAEPWNGMCVGE